MDGSVTLIGPGKYRRAAGVWLCGEHLTKNQRVTIRDGTDGRSQSTGIVQQIPSYSPRNPVGGLAL
jgi:hypothetical protein